MSYALISSERSPFGRICRMFMSTHKIPFEFRILNFVDNAEDERKLAQESPINKVPILVIDGKQKIFDSRVIINHLSRTHGLPALTLDEENIVSAIYSCLDVSVILFLMKRSGYDLGATNPYLQRQKDRLPKNLGFIREWAQNLDSGKSQDWNYASMSLFSFLRWAHVRAGILNLQDYPHFQQFLDKFAQAPGVRETEL